MSQTKKLRTRTPNKSSSFTIGKPDFVTEKRSILVLENSCKRSFAGAIADYLRYVLNVRCNVEDINGLLNIEDRDVFDTDLNQSLDHVGVGVKLYRYNNTSANFMYIAHCGTSPNVAYIVVQDTQKFSLIASMHGLGLHVDQRMCKNMLVNQYVDPAFVTPVKEKHFITPPAPVKRSQQTDENSDTPRIETMFKQSFEHSEQYMTPKAEKEPQVVAKPKKRSKKDQFMVVYKRINNKLVEQHLYMEQCLDVIAKLAETLAESAQKATNKSEDLSQHDRQVQIALSNGLIEQLVTKREHQKSIECAIDALLTRKKDIELFISVLGDCV